MARLVSCSEDVLSRATCVTGILFSIFLPFSVNKLVWHCSHCQQSLPYHTSAWWISRWCLSYWSYGVPGMVSGQVCKADVILTNILHNNHAVHFNSSFRQHLTWSECFCTHYKTDVHCSCHCSISAPCDSHGAFPGYNLELYPGTRMSFIGLFQMIHWLDISADRKHNNICSIRVSALSSLCVQGDRLSSLTTSKQWDLCTHQTPPQLGSTFMLCYQERPHHLFLHDT